MNSFKYTVYLCTLDDGMELLDHEAIGEFDNFKDAFLLLSSKDSKVDIANLYVDGGFEYADKKFCIDFSGASSYIGVQRIAYVHPVEAEIEEMKGKVAV